MFSASEACQKVKLTMAFLNIHSHSSLYLLVVFLLSRPQLSDINLQNKDIHFKIWVLFTVRFLATQYFMNTFSFHGLVLTYLSFVHVMYVSYWISSLTVSSSSKFCDFVRKPFIHMLRFRGVEKNCQTKLRMVNGALYFIAPCHIKYEKSCLENLTHFSNIGFCVLSKNNQFFWNKFETWSSSCSSRFIWSSWKNFYGIE